MKKFYLIAAVLIVIALVTAGCTYDPTGVVLGKNAEPTLSGTPVPASTIMVSPAPTPKTPSPGVPIPSESSGTIQSFASGSGTDWVFWREDNIDIRKGGYLTISSANDMVLKNLKVTIATDAPVDVRFTTIKQSVDYLYGWKKYYSDETAPSFDRNDAGYIKFYSGISDGNVEAQGDEGLVIFIEPHLDKPAKGTMKTYYKP
jgi:hypothetical protein